MQLNRLAAATTLLAVFSIPQFTSAAPMLLTVRGIVGEITDETGIIPAAWLESLLLVEATWSYDSDKAGSDSYPEAGSARYGYETFGGDGTGSDIHPAG